MVSFIKTNFPAYIKPQTVALQSPLRHYAEIAVDDPLSAEKISGTVGVGGIRNSVEIVVVERFVILLCLVVTTSHYKVGGVVERGTLAQLDVGIKGIYLLEEIISESLVAFPAEFPVADIVAVDSIP